MIVTLGNFASLILYLAVYFLSAWLLHLASLTKTKTSRATLALLAILVPCIIAGFRYGVGTDYQNYVYMYQQNSELTFFEYFQASNKIEFFVFLVIKFASWFNSPRLFFGVFSALIYAPIAKIIMEREDKSDNFFLALFFLLSTFSTGLNIMRQIAAASFSFYALKYVFTRKLIKFFLVIVLASLIHSTAIIVLPIYFIWNLENEFTIYQPKPWIIVAIYGIVAWNIPAILQIMGGRFDRYATGEIQGWNLSIILNCIWMIVFLLFNKQITSYKNQNGLYVFMIVIGTILSFTGIYNVYVKRIAIYFNYPDFILLTQLKYAFDIKSRQAFYLLATIYSVFMFLLTYYILGQGEIFPYAYRI